MIKTALLILLPLGLLTACSSNKASHDGPPAQASVPGSDKPALPDGSGGVYKTGNPYQIGGRWYRPMQSLSSYDESGVASWYGRDFHSKSTANGERYDMHALSAAHKTLPMPTLVRVTNLENGRSVIVRVNDRGPFVKDRLIDLSYAAARELGYDNKGTARVRVQTLDAPTDTPATPVSPPAPAPLLIAASPVPERAATSGHIYVQLGAFSSQANADQLRQSLLAQYPNTALYPKQLVNQTLYRVRIGPFEQMQQIEQTVISLQNSGFDNTIVVIE